MSSISSGFELGKRFGNVHFTFEDNVVVLNGFHAFIEEVRNGVTVDVTCANAYIVTAVALSVSNSHST